MCTEMEIRKYVAFRMVGVDGERGGKIGKEAEAKVCRAFYAMSWHLDIISSKIIFYKPVVSTLAVHMNEPGKSLKTYDSSPSQHTQTYSQSLPIKIWDTQLNQNFK